MTHKKTVERVNELFPGRMVSGNLSRGAFGKKDQWRWSLDTLGTKKFLTLILPYLVTKKEEAKIALLLANSQAGKPEMYQAARLKASR